MLALTSAGCEVSVGPVDRGRIVTSDGTELCPEQLPFEVIVSGEVEQPQAVVDAAESINDQLDVEAFIVYVDDAIFREMETGGDLDRLGTVLVDQGFVGTPGWADDLVGWDDVGGLADLRWDEDGLILFADVLINADIAYDRQTVRDVAAHELGHVLGLDHDDSSLDLGSCMASPAEYDCQLTESDVELVLGGCST